MSLSPFDRWARAALACRTGRFLGCERSMTLSQLGPGRQDRQELESRLGELEADYREDLRALDRLRAAGR